jgi:hypothetical protein
MSIPVSAPLGRARARSRMFGRQRTAARVASENSMGCSKQLWRSTALTRNPSWTGFSRQVGWLSIGIMRLRTGASGRRASCPWCVLVATATSAQWGRPDLGADSIAGIRIGTGCRLTVRADSASVTNSGYWKFGWCPGAESNHRHEDFQSSALPTELPGRFYSSCPLRAAKPFIKAARWQRVKACDRVRVFGRLAGRSIGVSGVAGMSPRWP